MNDLHLIHYESIAEIQERARHRIIKPLPHQNTHPDEDTECYVALARQGKPGSHAVALHSESEGTWSGRSD